MLRNADKIIANSINTLQSIPSEYHDKTSVIYNGIEINKIIQKSKSKERSTQLITVGRLIKIKNQVSLIRALYEIVKQKPNTFLNIIGSGLVKENLIALTQSLKLGDNVVFHGSLARREVYQLLSTSDIYLMPSRSEGFCNALVEGMCAGLPSVISDIPIFREISTDECSLYHHPDDPKGIGSHILRLIDDPQLQKTMGQAARNRAIHEFSLKKNALSHNLLYSNILS